MPENIVAILPELGVAIGQTFMMLAIGLSAALLIGGPLGILLFLLGPGQSLANRPAFLILNWLVNTVRSFPFIILLVALVPFTRIVAGTSIGPLAASVPLDQQKAHYKTYAEIIARDLNQLALTNSKVFEAVSTNFKNLDAQFNFSFNTHPNWAEAWLPKDKQ